MTELSKFKFPESMVRDVPNFYKEGNKIVGYYIYDGKYYYSINKEDVV